MIATKDHECSVCAAKRLSGAPKASDAPEPVGAESTGVDLRRAGNMAMQRRLRSSGETRGGDGGPTDAGVAPSPDAGPAPADAGAPASPAGGLTINVTQAAKSLTKCGSAEFKVHWNPPAGKDGWVIQHINFVPAVTDAAGAAVTANNLSLEYWEGWQVSGGKTYVGFASGGSEHVADTFRTVSEGANKKGSVSITGAVKFISGYNLTKPPWGNAVPEAGSLPTVKSSPAGWSESDTLSHSMVVNFDCTDGDAAKHTQTVTTNP